MLAKPPPNVVPNRQAVVCFLVYYHCCPPQRHLIIPPRTLSPRRHLKMVLHVHCVSKYHGPGGSSAASQTHRVRRRPVPHSLKVWAPALSIAPASEVISPRQHHAAMWFVQTALRSSGTNLMAFHYKMSGQRPLTFRQWKASAGLAFEGHENGRVQAHG